MFPAVKLDPVPVIFVPTSVLGVPRAGVTSVGLVDITTLPVPVIALDTRLSEPSVKTASLSVRPEILAVAEFILPVMVISPEPS